ncbi:MAG: hypothetical protein QM622_00295 [Microbacterium sp.]
MIMGGSDDDLDIRSGGVVAVDTASLRDAAARLTLLGSDGADVHETLAQAVGILIAAGIWLHPPAERAQDLATDAAAIAADLRTLADTYEYLELSAAADLARAAGDVSLVWLLHAQRRALESADPFVGLRAEAALAQWRRGVDDGLAAKFDPVGAVLGVPVASGGGLLAGLLGVVSIWGRGTASTPLTGAGEAVSTPVLRRESTSAPDGLVTLAQRMPGEGDSRIRIEDYTMPDGSHEYVAYAAGTTTVTAGVSPDAFDMGSNFSLYSGERAASYDAVLQALADAGAQPGDAVHLVGHSQGAMVASAVALAGVYTVPTLVTFGSPVQPDVGSTTLNVALRHRDDPVVGLADGGRATSAGSADSIVVERTVERIPWSDTPLAAHHLSEYEVTAAAADASPDPRMDAVRDTFDHLGTAASVAVTVYGAERADWPPVPSPSPAPVPPDPAALTGAADAG